MAAVSTAEVIQICNGFLLASPPGELMEVVTDVRGLLQNDAILNDTAPATFREYNTEQMVQVKSPNGAHQVLITKYGEIGNSDYLDPKGGSILHFDHIRQEVTGSRAIGSELDQSVESFRRAVDDSVTAYTAEHYPNGAATVYGSHDSSANKITVCISSSRFNPGNFWNGRWRSVWTATFKPGGNVTFTGTIKVQVHYYEDGNVQLVTSANKSASFSGPNDPKGFAEALTKQLSKIEQDYHSSLETSYTTMGETTFKALRRVLPITRQRMDWDKIKAMKISNEIGRN